MFIIPSVAIAKNIIDPPTIVARPGNDVVPQLFRLYTLCGARLRSRIRIMGSSFVCFLTPGNAVEPADDGPFREQFWLGLEVAWLPVFRQVVLVRIVFGESTARGINIPEIRR